MQKPREWHKPTALHYCMLSPAGAADSERCIDMCLLLLDHGAAPGTQQRRGGREGGRFVFVFVFVFEWFGFGFCRFHSKK